MVQHIKRSVKDFANNNEVLKGTQSGSMVNLLMIWAAQDEGDISEKEDIENDIDMQGLSPCRRLSIDFDAVVLPDPDTLDLNHPNELPQAYKLDDIKVEYHPHSKLPSVVHHFADFSHSCSSEGQFVRFIDEPWTADAFWNAQSQLPPDAKPLTFILYADKNKLSTFGTAKGYLIVACIANLPVHIHNGNMTLGGGRIVGWLPIVAKNQKHTRKKSIIDFKNAVWHKSFYQLLKSIELHSKNGYWFECGDQTQHRLWPLILILSGDYEEKCVMALIHGLKGKFPCPCRFPTGPLHRKSKMYGKEKAEDLKACSLQNVEEAATKLDANFDAIPRWPNLTHFKAVMLVNFNDGSFHEDISKLVLFTVQDVLLKSKSKIGYLLLRCIHYYLELNIYASFKVHTKETIVAGRATLVKFSELMDISFSDEYITQSQPEMNKNWNFPKKHMITHIFNDILAKGATHNYNTKLNEKMHGALRKIYLQWTNFKDIAPQILNYDHWLLTLACMRTELDELDDYVRKATNDPETNEPLDIELAADPVIHAHLGSKQGQHSFSDIACAHETDRAFNDFQTKLNGFLNVFLPQNDIPLPDGRALCPGAEDEITEFRFLWVNYESMVDWRMHQDLLRCSPKFYESPRFDCVIVKTTGKPFIARLVYLFGCSIGNTHFPLALIHPYDAGIGIHRRWDVDLGLWRVRAKPWSSSEIISVWLII
ncbi:uncharacterized protein F5891DRAFT_1196801 [Suillus fuscotomentosus]|uniref:Uncharacterized protein n=1 Tax=Suillus fuscotomentosus TaxID=1912939 RepID=A0AAD4DSM0_9AGAM|nr:uncharacterized protein F5891DRAFT_1196801 [Suillus fuscotomentosus]KAG1893170.1 hypothetical protein F5891DRAFT_1196801 [Suillus fuscotomentosus]